MVDGGCFFSKTKKGSSINDVRILSKDGFMKLGHFRTKGGKGIREFGRPNRILLQDINVRFLHKFAHAF